MKESESRQQPAHPTASGDYQPPKVDSVLTSEQLEREVLYAGVNPYGGCDRNLKENFAPVEPSEILEKLAGLRIERWNYKAENPSVRHIGPMAQDFAAAFGVGADDRYIRRVDAFGVAFAAIQALHDLHRRFEAEHRGLAERLRHLQAANTALRERVAAIEGQTPMTFGEPASDRDERSRLLPAARPNPVLRTTPENRRR
jgi:hypothetical protein